MGGEAARMRCRRRYNPIVPLCLMRRFLCSFSVTLLSAGAATKAPSELWGNVLRTFLEKEKYQKIFALPKHGKGKSKDAASSNNGLRADALRRFDDGAERYLSGLTEGYIKALALVPQHAFNRAICNFFISATPIASHIISGLLW